MADNPELRLDPPTALWRTLPNAEKSEGPKRSHLARAYREHLGEDWRDYYAGPYEDDGPNEWED
jgi:hypothetical protein